MVTRNSRSINRTILVAIQISFSAAAILNIFNLYKKRIPISVVFVMLSTFTSWYFPVVYFNSDFIFTMANILAHGIRYMALVWLFEKKRDSLWTWLEFFFYFYLWRPLWKKPFGTALSGKNTGLFLKASIFCRILNTIV